MQRQKILFLSPCTPAIPIGGMEVKSYHLLRRLTQEHDVTLVTMGFEKEQPLAKIEALEDLGAEVIPLLANRKQALARAALYWYKPLPLEVALFEQPLFKNTVKTLLQERTFDIGISFFMRTAEFLKNEPLRKILVAEDCRTLYQRRSVNNGQSIKQMAVRQWEVMKLRAYEPDIVNYFDRVTFVSDTDIDEMNKMQPDTRYRLLTNGVEIEKYTFVENHRQRKHLVFFGKLDVWANEVMARKCALQILPLIHRSMPDVELHIVGASATDGVRRLLSDKVFLHENVQAVQPFITRAAVMIHPHAGASGIQNKVLEAMALGCPVVTTPTGVQGIDATHGQEVLIGGTIEELAVHCLFLLQQPEQRAAMARAARRVIEKNHTWNSAVFSQLDAIIDEVAALPHFSAVPRPASEKVLDLRD